MARYRSSATSTTSFHPPHKGRFRLMVRDNGAAVGASWCGWIPAAAAEETPRAEDGSSEDAEKGGGERGQFDLVTQAGAPVVVFDRPKGAAAGVGGQKAGAGAAGGKSGGLNGEEGEVVEEKSMFQK